MDKMEAFMRACADPNGYSGECYGKGEPMSNMEYYQRYFTDKYRSGQN